MKTKNRKIINPLDLILEEKKKSVGAVVPSQPHVVPPLFLASNFVLHTCFGQLNLSYRQLMSLTVGNSHKQNNSLDCEEQTNKLVALLTFQTHKINIFTLFKIEDSYIFIPLFVFFPLLFLFLLMETKVASFQRYSAKQCVSLRNLYLQKPEE